MAIRFIRLPEVCRTVGLPKSTVYKLMTEGDFPRPVKLTSRVSAWLEEEIDGWKQERIAATRQGEAA
ncbi:MAG: AlpA family transcriptional regulator [Gammaproteobacteria bacterium]|nr:AlpA family transcriptional regulator [Gammaproteobacteria bacterium]